MGFRSKASQPQLEFEMAPFSFCQIKSLLIIPAKALPYPGCRLVQKMPLSNALSETYEMKSLYLEAAFLVEIILFNIFRF